MTELPGSEFAKSLVESYKSEQDKSIKAFISYSANDKDIAAKVKETLKNFNVECFLAHEDIGVSEEWKERILLELKSADIFIPILSLNFRESDWCSQEAGIAAFRDVLIIPLCIDKKTKPYGFIGHLQGKRIKHDEVPLKYLTKPIKDKFPEIEIIKSLINELNQAHNYDYADEVMRALEPYFNELTNEEIDTLVNHSISNNQVHALG